jgi:intracellular sulfur oxidation DsrE/DsrF family protein
MTKRILSATFVLGLFALPTFAQEDSTGPVIESHGPVYAIPDAVAVGDPTAGLKAVFDIAVGSEDPAALNRRIETVARYLNMHVAAGYPADSVHAALVLHGSAARDALDNKGFQKRYGVDNPNLALLEALRESGVEVFLCGQSREHRGFAPGEIAPSVRVALSAMTVLLAKQREGYGLIAF